MAAHTAHPDHDPLAGAMVNPVTLRFSDAAVENACRSDYYDRSIGVACLASTDEADFDALIDRADAALYEAKNAGRNQLRVSVG
jgi:diguanylate cyclase (GGDEF)-like protein